MEEVSKREDNAMSNYFIAIEVFSNVGVILELNNHFQAPIESLFKSNTEIEFVEIVKRN